MNPTILGVMGPGFLNQVPTVGWSAKRRRPKVRGVRAQVHYLHLKPTSLRSLAGKS